MTTSFTDMLPELIEESRRLYGTFSIIASVLVFSGLTISAVNGSFGDLSRALRGLVTAALVVAMIGILAIYPISTGLGGWDPIFGAMRKYTNEESPYEEETGHATPTVSAPRSRSEMNAAA